MKQPSKLSSLELSDLLYPNPHLNSDKQAKNKARPYSPSSPVNPTDTTTTQKRQITAETWGQWMCGNNWGWNFAETKQMWGYSVPGMGYYQESHVMKSYVYNYKTNCSHPDANKSWFRSLSPNWSIELIRNECKHVSPCSGALPTPMHHRA